LVCPHEEEVSVLTDEGVIDGRSETPEEKENRTRFMFSWEKEGRAFSWEELDETIKQMSITDTKIIGKMLEGYDKHRIMRNKSRKEFEEMHAEGVKDRADISDRDHLRQQRISVFGSDSESDSEDQSLAEKYLQRKDLAGGRKKSGSTDIPKEIVELHTRAIQNFGASIQYVGYALWRTRLDTEKTTTAKTIVDKHAANGDKEQVYELFTLESAELGNVIESAIAHTPAWSPRLLKAVEAIILEVWYPNSQLLLACQQKRLVTVYKEMARSVHQGFLIKKHEFFAEKDWRGSLNNGQEAARQRAMAGMSPLMLQCVKGEATMPQVSDEKVRREMITWQKTCVVKLLTPIMQNEIMHKESGWKGGHIPIGIAESVLMHGMENGEHDVPLIVEKIANGADKLEDILKLEMGAISMTH